MQSINEYFNKLRSQAIGNNIVYVLLFVITIFLAFSAGVLVGIEKAKFSYSWGDNYYHNFVGRPDIFPDKKYMNARGVFGEILKSDNNYLLIKGEDGNERNVAVSANTTIRRGNEELKITDLKLKNKIIIIGSPNDQGQIEARLIRVAPVDFAPPPFFPPNLQK